MKTPGLNLKHNRNYFVISDTHFRHVNSLAWPGRNHFSNIDEADEVQIENWNRVVKPGDRVYHLGDVFMGPSTHEERARLMSRLVGSKSLIVGNHDDIPYLSKGGWFRKVQLWKVFVEFNCLMTHVPVHESCIHERLLSTGGFNVHGHLHTRVIEPGPYVNVCVEQIDFTPMNLEELRDTNTN